MDTGTPPDDGTPLTDLLVDSDAPPEPSLVDRMLPLIGGATFWWVLMDVLLMVVGSWTLLGIGSVLVVPALIGLALGYYAGRNRWAEGAIAGAIAAYLHGIITVLIVAVPADVELEVGILNIIFVVGFASTSALVVAVASYLGSAGSYLPPPGGPSHFWAWVGVAALTAPVVLPLADLAKDRVNDVRPARVPEAGAAATSSAPPAATGPTRPAPPPPDSTAHVRVVLLEALEAQELHYATHGRRYAATAEELGIIQYRIRFEVDWAGDAGWSGQARDLDDPRLECAVYVGTVPPEHRSPILQPDSPPRRPTCR